MDIIELISPHGSRRAGRAGPWRVSCASAASCSAVLERHVLEKTRIQGRAIAAAVDPVSAIDSLEKSFEYRNGLVAEFMTTKFDSDKQKIEKYLGRPTAAGVDDSFRGLVLLMPVALFASAEGKSDAQALTIPCRWDP